MTMPLVEPTFVKQSNVTFEYPYAAPTTTLTMPCPALGDIERYSHQRILRETRGGDLIVFRDPTWPEDNELALTFTNIRETVKDTFEQLLDETLGTEIKYTDHFGQIWKAIITNPETAIVTDSAIGCGSYTVNLTLNVELISWP